MATNDRSHGRGYLATFGILAAVFSGCGSNTESGPPKYPVSGKVTYNGQPISGARVTLYRLPLNTTDPNAVHPNARVQPDGTFRVSTDGDADGATAGEYAITVKWSGGDGRWPGPDLLKDRFTDAKKPVTKVTVGPGENVIPEIKLTGPKVGAAGNDDTGGPRSP